MHPATEPQFQRIYRQLDRLLAAVQTLRTERTALLNRVAELEQALETRGLQLADAQTRQQLRTATTDPETPLALATNTREALRGQVDDMIAQIDDALKLMNE